MYADFHTHTWYSGDSWADPEANIKAAISKGMKIICVTDHRDLDFPKPMPKRFDSIDYREYFRYWNNLKDKYSGKIDIRIGIEAGIEPQTAARQKITVDCYPFDFVLNSAHVVSRKYVMYDDFFNFYGSKKGVQLYFERILENTYAFTDFDSLSHLDFMCRFVPDGYDYKDENHFEIISEILKRIISLNKCLEINTAGIYKGKGETNPAPRIIKSYRELGGEMITIGSDAHTPDRIGACFDETGSMLKAAGFRYYCVFKNRKPEFLRL